MNSDECIVLFVVMVINLSRGAEVRFRFVRLSATTCTA